MTELNARYFALVEDDDRSQQGQSATTSPLRLVQIRCFPDRKRDQVWILERTTTPVPRSEVGDVLGDAATTYIAEKFSNAAFANTDRWWIVRDPGGLGTLAHADGAVVDGLHQLLLGDPTAKVVANFLPRPDAAVAAGIAAQIPLPIDGPAMLIKTCLEVAGMAVGVLAGLPVLTTACCKSFLHDQLTRGAASGVKAVVRGLASPASSPKRAGPEQGRSRERDWEGRAQGPRPALGAAPSPRAWRRGPARPAPPAGAPPPTRGRQDTSGRRDRGGRGDRGGR